MLKSATKKFWREIFLHLTFYFSANCALLVIRQILNNWKEWITAIFNASKKLSTFKFNLNVLPFKFLAYFRNSIRLQDNYLLLIYFIILPDTKFTILSLNVNVKVSEHFCGFTKVENMGPVPFLMLSPKVIGWESTLGVLLRVHFAYTLPDSLLIPH